jgi:hypothetical protein
LSPTPTFGRKRDKFPFRSHHCSSTGWVRQASASAIHRPCCGRHASKRGVSGDANFQPSDKAAEFPQALSESPAYFLGQREASTQVLLSGRSRVLSLNCHRRGYKPLEMRQRAFVLKAESGISTAVGVGAACESLDFSPVRRGLFA